MNQDPFYPTTTSQNVDEVQVTNKAAHRHSLPLVIGLIAFTLFLAIGIISVFAFLTLSGTLSKPCEYNGQVYQFGESIDPGDGCNSCSCSENGEVACTEIACVNAPADEVSNVSDLEEYVNKEKGYRISYSNTYIRNICPDNEFALFKTEGLFVSVNQDIYMHSCSSGPREKIDIKTYEKNDPQLELIHRPNETESIDLGNTIGGLYVDSERYDLSSIWVEQNDRLHIISFPGVQSKEEFDDILQIAKHFTIIFNPTDKGSTIVNNPIVGKIITYRFEIDGTYVEITAESREGTITDMMIWTDTNPTQEWQQFNGFELVKPYDVVFIRFRDDQGNVSNVYADGSYSKYSPPYIH